MQSFTYNNFPLEVSNVHFALFSNVENASQIRSRIINAAKETGPNGESERAAVNYAFVEATLVTSRRHIQAAIYQSLLAYAHNSLKTKTVHSEIIYSLNPTSNITEAFRTYGVSPTSRSLILIRIGSPADLDAEMLKMEMTSVVHGDLVPFDTLANITDWRAVIKHHKLSAELKSQKLEEYLAQQQFVDEIVTSSTAMKIAAS